MRTLSATLLAAQKSGRINALVKIVLTQGENEYTYTRTRIIDISRDEEGAYSHKAKVVLFNGDRALSELDFKGYQAVISRGMVTVSGEEYSAVAPLWVTDQKEDSGQGYLNVILTMEGIPNLLARDKALDSYLPDATDTKTVKTLINALMGVTSPFDTAFAGCTAYTVDYDSEDSLIDTYTPKQALRVYVGQSRLSILRKLLDYTGCVVRFGYDGHLHIFVPSTNG